jgi:hypothetical protein
MPASLGCGESRKCRHRYSRAPADAGAGVPSPGGDWRQRFKVRVAGGEKNFLAAGKLVHGDGRKLLDCGWTLSHQE